MYNYMASFVVLSIFLKTALTDGDLHQQNVQENHLNPLNDDNQQDISAKDQDKRTVFSPTVSNYGWAKHVGVNPTGMKYVIGYAPVDLKYVPVIRPVSIQHHHHHGYHYGKPKFHHHHHRVQPIIHLKPAQQFRPSPGDGWRPALSVVKPVVPVVPVNVPPPHLVTKPWDHYEKPVAVVKPVLQVPPPAIPVQTVVPVQPVHQVTVVKPVHIKPVRPVHPVFPVHHYPIVQPAPVVPISAPGGSFIQFAPVPKPFVPSPLFEVTRPNLGVLPLGASFPSPVLQPVPSGPAAIPLPPHFKPAVLPQQLPPHQVAPQPFYPPGTVVEYHGTHNFVSSNGHVPVPLPQNPVQPLYPPHVHQVYPQNVHVHEIPQNVHHVHEIPQNVQHVHEIPQNVHHVHEIPQNVPHVHEIPQNVHHVHEIPQNVHQIPQNVHPVQYPQSPAVPQHEQHDVQTPFLPANHPNFFQQQLPPVDVQQHFQPADHSSSQPPLHEQGIPNIQHFSESGIIQPGQTDLQLPLHLPHHNFMPDGRQFQPGNFHDPSQYPDHVFKPSISLEPPYINKRNEDDEK